MKASDLNPDRYPGSEGFDERSGRYDLPRERRMRRLINRLLDEAPKLEGHEDQYPAIETNVTIRGLLQPLSGALSITPEGTLRLLVPVPGKAGEQASLVEVFFDYCDVSTIALERKPEASMGSRIIQPS